MANLQPLDYEHDDKVSVSAAVGNYNGQTAMAVGAYYRPNSKMMFSVSGSFGSGENMIGAGISAKFDKTYEIDRMSEEQLKNKIEMLNESNAAHSSEYSLTACDLKHPGYSCHVFRHSCGTNLYKETKDLRLVQDTLRHSAPKVTARYAHVADRLTKRYTSKKENLSLSSMRYNFSPWHDRPSHEFSAANFIPKLKLPTPITGGDP